MFSKYKLFRCYIHSVTSKVFKSSKAKRKTKISPNEKALEHFDDFYQPIFKKEWPSIRLGLLSGRKYLAALNNYSDIDITQNKLENLGAISVQRLFEIESTKILERKHKRSKIRKSNEIGSTLSEITEKKLEEEQESLYSKGDKEAENFSVEASDRYVDPSLGLSQLYEYVPATELKGSDDWVPESAHYSYYKTGSDLDITLIKEEHLPFPSSLHLYSFEPGNVSHFPPPRKGVTGVSDYYLLDGGSLLPVLALDLQPDDAFLDLCAAPGGKSYLAIQTLYPKTVCCNDVSISRANRIVRMMQEFFYDFDKKMKSGEIQITTKDARDEDAFGRFNKILVDVPCTTDRHSVKEEDNNIFSPNRLKERIRLPELQSEILIAALHMVEVGGTVVYSTCSLSPIQNDGVVNMALEKISEKTNHQIAVVDMTQALEATKVLYRYSNIGLRFGHLVQPYIVNNFGPTYFCKLKKLR